MFCLGGFCPGGFWQGGFLSRGFLSGGLCPGGFCLGGFVLEPISAALISFGSIRMSKLQSKSIRVTYYLSFPIIVKSGSVQTFAKLSENG